MGAVLLHTNLLEYLVALVDHKALDIAQTKVLVANEGVKTAGSGDDDVRVSSLVLENRDVVLDGSTTVEDRGLNVRQVLAETCVLVLDLESQFTGVANNHDRALAVHRLNLLKGGQDENGSFTKTRLGLTENVGSENGLRNAVLLDCGHECQKSSRVFNASERSSERRVHPSQNKRHATGSVQHPQCLTRLPLPCNRHFLLTGTGEPHRLFRAMTQFAHKVR